MAWQPEDRERWPEWDQPATASRESIVHVLRMIAEGKLHPEMAVRWAKHHEASATDPAVQAALRLVLACADRVDTQQYLFSRADYAAWADELEA